MKKPSLVIIATVFIFGNIIETSSMIQGQKTVPEFSKNDSVTLPYLLPELGNKYDCFFTIEDSMNENDPSSSLRAQRILNSSEANNLSNELERLRQTIPNFTYEFNKQNAKIVHIIDARLLQRKRYALQDVIGSIDFKGQINELPAEISKHGISVDPMLSYSLHEHPDFITTVEVKGERLSVRDALTNFVPLEGRLNRTLWVARTNVAEGSLTKIYYPASGKKP
jgi:hypothetical protein